MAASLSPLDHRRRPARSVPENWHPHGHPLNPQENNYILYNTVFKFREIIAISAVSYSLFVGF